MIPPGVSEGNGNSAPNNRQSPRGHGSTQTSSQRARPSKPSSSHSGDSVAEWAEARPDDLERTTATDDRVLPASNPLHIKGAAREAHTVSKFPYSPPKSPRSRRRRLCRTAPTGIQIPTGTLVVGAPCTATRPLATARRAPQREHSCPTTTGPTQTWPHVINAQTMTLNARW